jgi:glycosyltransferase involved in cell wall biosynthesis
MVTIITPTIKRDPNIIKRCIESVNGQSYTNWEHIMISDCPAEQHVIDLIEQMPNKDKRRYLFNDSGYYGTWGAIPRNMGINSADQNSKYIIFLDDDNIIFPHHLRTMVDLIGDKKAALCSIYHNGPLNLQLIPEYQEMLKHKTLSFILSGEVQTVGRIDSLNIFVRKDIMQKCGWTINTNYVNDGETIERLFKEFVGGDYNITNEILALHY